MRTSSVINVRTRPPEYHTDLAYALRLFKDDEMARRGITATTLDKSIICGGVVETTGELPEEMSL
jgi:hypothetical protein